MVIGRNFFVIVITIVHIVRIGVMLVVLGVRIVCGVPVIIMRLAETLFAVKDQEVHAERVEGSNEHTRQHGEVGEAGTGDM